MFLTFATYKFEGVKLPQSWTSSAETLYGQVPLIGGKASVQLTGEKLEEIELGIYLSAEFCNPKTELDALHALRKAGTVSYLVNGAGNNFGKFVITGIDSDVQTATPEGYATGISATLKLLEYNSTATTTKKTGAAYRSQNPKEVAPLVPLKTPMVEILTTQKTAVAASLKVTDTINQGQVSVGKLSRMQEHAQSAIDSFNTVSTQINNSRKLLYRNASAVRSSINQANGYLTNIKTLASRLKDATEQIQNIPGAVLGADSVQDYVDLANNGSLLSGALYALNVASAPMAGVVGSREGGI